MVRLTQGAVTGVYYIDPKKKRVSTPPGNTGFVFLPGGYAYNRRGRLLTIPLDGTEAKMDLFDARLSIRPGILEFTALDKAQVRVHH